LYTTTSTSSYDLDFDAVITHRATVAPAQTKQPDTAGADAALAALQNSMASYQQEKKAKSATITDDVIPEPKRWEAAKKQRRGLLGMNSGSSSPSLSAIGTPRAGLSVTSAPNDQNIRRQAMKIPIVHLLAMEPISTEDIIRTTHIPKSDLEAVVGKIAQQVDGKWKLLDRAYKDLNVWDFGYRTQEDRQMAIDNAIRAYDRTRVGREENIWQLLLPKEERGKGKVLSKLHLSAPQTNRGSTPSHMPSPLLDASEDEKPISSANTPRNGQSGTPKPTVAKSAGSDMMKRLLAKDPKKARAAEEAKEKRKREREAVAGDREGRPVKKQKPASSTIKSTNASGAATKASSKIKSAELVHSSDDDDEEGEVKDSPSVAPSRPGKLVAPSTVRPKALATRSPESGDNHVRPTKLATKASVNTKTKTSAPSIKPTASPAVKPVNTVAPGGSTPSNSALSAPQRHRTQLSPSKSYSRPTVPSPLGAARPRNASDVSDRSAVGVQRTKQGGASTPKGLGITSVVNGVRKKRQDTVTSHESFTSSEGDKNLPASKAVGRAPVTNGVSSQRSVVANSVKPTTNNKRKAEEPLPRGHTGSDLKHRKADSVSTTSQRSHSSSFGTVRTMATTNGTSPDAVFDSGSSDSSGSVNDTITYEQGIEKAKNFREKYYPQYIKLYDSISDRQSKGETIRQDEREKLWKMHRRLEELKREIGVAAKRGEA
jgi:RNA polymerase II elongation factor ELL